MDANKQGEQEAADVAQAATDTTEVSGENASILSFDETVSPEKSEEASVLGLHGHIKSHVDADELPEYIATLSDEKKQSLAKRFPSIYGEFVSKESTGDIESRLEAKLTVKSKLKEYCDTISLTAKDREKVVEQFNKLSKNNTPNAAYLQLIGQLTEKGFSPKKAEAKKKKEAVTMGSSIRSSENVAEQPRTLSQAAFYDLETAEKRNFLNKGGVIA